MYTSYSSHVKRKLGGKAYKVVVSTGFTCPTRDGTLMKNGCAFCDVRGSSSFHAKKGRGDEVKKQIDSRFEAIKKRFNAEKLIAYFQSYTNTYTDDLGELKELYLAAIEHPEIHALSIGTRPDCLSQPILELIESLTKIKPVILELGVQSLENRSLEWLARGHTAEQSLNAIQEIKTFAPNVELSVHLMFGMPTDLPTTPQRTAEILSRYPVDGVKLHQLMVLENTGLAERYKRQPFGLVTLDEYTDIIRRFITHLSPSIYIERLYATATHPEECIGPDWSTERWKTHNTLRKGIRSLSDDHTPVSWA